MYVYIMKHVMLDRGELYITSYRTIWRSYEAFNHINLMF
jgi:hypothetical protein